MPEATAVTGGYDANSDSRIRAPLREWVVAQKAASALGDRLTGDRAGEAAYCAACDHLADLAVEIAKILAGSAVGLAIKAYLRHHYARAAHSDPPEALAELAEDGIETNLKLSVIAGRRSSRTRARAAGSRRYPIPRRGQGCLIALSDRRCSRPVAGEQVRSAGFRACGTLLNG
jgi:hypothetical protein